MGELGRTPQIGTQGSTDGRNHWPYVMSMALAGGGLRHGQVIGATEKDGGAIRERPVTPGDIAATIYRHIGVPLESTYEDFRGRPRQVVLEGGKPLRELVRAMKGGRSSPERIVLQYISCLILPARKVYTSAAPRSRVRRTTESEVPAALSRR
jgi:hypothetical protein